MTIAGEGNASVCGEDWRYIRYVDGTEELYDLKADPQEWDNLISKMNSEAEAAKTNLSRFVPSEFAPGIANSDPKLKKEAKGIDQTLKASRRIDQLK